MLGKCCHLASVSFVFFPFFFYQDGMLIRYSYNGKDGLLIVVAKTQAKRGDLVALFRLYFFFVGSHWFLISFNTWIFLK